MSTRILLSTVRDGWCGWDAQIADFKDFTELANSDDILWGDHIHVYTDADYLPRAQEFIDAVEAIRWPDVIGFVEKWSREPNAECCACHRVHSVPGDCRS